MMLTTEEKLMFEVMGAIYDSGIPVDLKGSMALKACLIEAGYSGDTRYTLGIDANWRSSAPPPVERMTESLQKAIDRLGFDLNVSLYRMYGESRSAGFDIADRATGEIMFTMDVDVNQPKIPTRVYEVNGLRFCGVSPFYIIVDMISVISSDMVFQRIDDVIDLYYFSRVFEFGDAGFFHILQSSGKTLGNFDGFLRREDDLRQAYDNFRFTGNVTKPMFDEVYRGVKEYIYTILQNEKSRENRTQ